MCIVWYCGLIQWNINLCGNNSDGGTDPIKLFNPATLMCLFQASICIYPTPYIVSTDLMIEVVVDIDENVDHHCLLFSFIKLDNGIF